MPLSVCFGFAVGPQEDGFRQEEVEATRVRQWGLRGHAWLLVRLQAAST